ncbi:KIAA1430-like protein-domain-containing protein [Powellomyces hirtus]|nr:KIAA1430-like protein-domain-containing protein [Powellomyces hirtus]
MHTHLHTHQHPTPPPPQRWSHRHFPTYHPTSSKLLSKKWEERAREIHLAKLRNVSCSVDNAPPKRWTHLEVRLKRLQVEQERLYEIERNNHILLDRIAFQMTTPSTLHPPPVSAQSHPAHSTPHSLHGPKRAAEQRHIARENQNIMQRIEDKAPNYRRVEWGLERCRNLEYLRNIAAFSESYERVLERHCEKERPRTAVGGRRGSARSGSEGGRQRPQRATTAGGAQQQSQQQQQQQQEEQEQESWIPVLRTNGGRPQTRVNTMTGPLSEDESDTASQKQRVMADHDDANDTPHLSPQQEGEPDHHQQQQKLPPLVNSRPTSASISPSTPRDASRPTSASVTSTPLVASSRPTSASVTSRPVSRPVSASVGASVVRK